MQVSVSAMLLNPLPPQARTSVSASVIGQLAPVSLDGCIERRGGICHAPNVDSADGTGRALETSSPLPYSGHVRFVSRSETGTHVTSGDMTACSRPEPLKDPMFLFPPGRVPAPPAVKINTLCGLHSRRRSGALMQGASRLFAEMQTSVDASIRPRC